MIAGDLVLPPPRVYETKSGCRREGGLSGGRKCGNGGDLVTIRGKTNAW